ncbi:sterol desaturase family protein [Leptolyngbya sp. 7M]|uniref:sterol desaturase family protein n=1 Tax=Leptolyngbya sp. 7M TaxID=2812896 RepID=UPI001B8C9CEF|nr:sterol desaturase family protein [Leptolyngbya sp. 7M]QYO66424.1 sterol desaturase family protein [Leptolyngbya sp. 7M]
MLKPTIIAIPVFALLIGLEAWYSHRRRANAYEARDAWTNIFVGFVSVGFGILFGVFVAVIYTAAYELAPYKFPADAWWSWVLLFFVDDLAYYWFHRVSHEMRLFWNFHVVHHSSEHYNLSVAVRQSWFSGLLHWIFYAPIMLLGFAPWMFALMHGFNLIYQFWIHTKFIKTLGPLEYVLNTPSHHRVHHGVNNPYLDKNYAGVLIIWDRLFGSFVPESEEPKYGIIKPIKSFNPLWINTHGWVEMRDAMRQRRTLLGKLKCIFGSPNMDIEELAQNVRAAQNS